MSDRETIVSALTDAQARIRRNRTVERIIGQLQIFLLVAVAVKLIGLFILFGTGTMRLFWAVWTIALAISVIRNLSAKEDLSHIAADLDRKARLQEEVVSAYWFLGQHSTNPWIDLQIRRTAETLGKVNLGNLYPGTVPKKTFAVAIFAVLLFVLNFAPLPFTPNMVFSTPTPDVAMIDRDAELDEIEALLAEAAALNPEAGLTIEEFQELVSRMRDSELGLTETADQNSQVEGLVNEGNLNTNNLLEGLEEIGSDLQRSEESETAGEALSRGDLQAAAEEFEQLAQQLSEGAPPSNELQEALSEASENSRAGLEDLAAALEAAANALGEENLDAARDSLMDAAESLGDISDMIESQQLQNQAAQQMSELREALREQQQQQSQQGQQGEGSPENSDSAQSQGGDQGEQQNSSPEPGEAGASVPQEGQGGTPQEGFQPGSAEGASEFVPGQSPEGSSADQLAPPITGDLENLPPTGSGETPTGLGFSPAQKTGDPTSLEVQLQMESTFASSTETPPASEPERREEASKQERSTLDYRNVPSELSPAQQELLNQERVPRQYQNVIKEYFQAIRPPR